MQKFAFLTDLHYGFERRNGHKVPLHDQRAIDAALSFLGDFKPGTRVEPKPSAQFGRQDDLTLG